MFRRLLRETQQFLEKGVRDLLLNASRIGMAFHVDTLFLCAWDCFAFWDSTTVFSHLFQHIIQIDRVAAQNPWPERQRTLYRFQNLEEIARWQTFSDSQLGGMSTAELIPSTSTPGTAEFRGMYSREIGQGASANLKRSGFAGMSSRSQDGEYLDLDDFHSLVFRVLGDGRKYLANIRTDNWVVGESAEDVWQAFLFSRKGEWQDVEIPLNRFLLTWRGKVIEQRVEMNPARITGVGISLAGGEELQSEGPFQLGIEWIAARNNAVVVGEGNN